MTTPDKTPAEIHVSFVSQVPDLAAFKDLLFDYYTDVGKIARAAGVPAFEAEDMVASSIDSLAEMLPPHGRLALAHDGAGRLVGCGAFRRVRPDAVEMKRMFVRPEARGTGLGRRLFEMRIEEARKAGYSVIYADTAKGNRPMLEIYERYGFRYIPRYPENANPPEFEPYLVFLEYRL